MYFSLQTCALNAGDRNYTGELRAMYCKPFGLTMYASIRLIKCLYLSKS